MDGQPFAMTEKEGQLFGLGAGNMKGAVAALLVAYAWLADNKHLWQGKIR